MADDKPWVERKAGDLLTSADWNAMQRMARAEIAEVQTGLAAQLAGVSRGGVEVHSAEMEPGTGANLENNLGTHGSSKPSASNYSGPVYTVQAQSQSPVYGSLSGGYWDFFPSPTLTLSLKSPAVVLLSAEAHLYFGSSYGYSTYVCTQFVVADAQGQRAPVRVNQHNFVSEWGLSSYSPGVQPGASTWAQWLSYHHTYFTSNSRRWPMAGRVLLSNSANGSLFGMSEAVELPAGTHKVNLGFSTNLSASQGYYLQIHQLRLSAMTFPS